MLLLIPITSTVETSESSMPSKLRFENCIINEKALSGFLMDMSRGMPIDATSFLGSVTVASL